MRKFILILFLCAPAVAFAQDDMALLADNSKQYVSATFKGSHIINFESVETQGKGVLEFMIQHRFGDINGGINSFFGLDNGATIRFGLGYGISKNLEVGIGRTSYEKMLDGYLKYRLLRQTEDGIPVSVTVFGSVNGTTQTDPNAAANGFNRYHYVGDRLSYVIQPIIAHKFSDLLSLQLSPTYIHYNMVENISDKNDALVLGFAGRYKFSKRMAVTAEYGARYMSYTASKDYHNTLGIGWEIETGGHVFQMFITNSTGITAPQYLTHTTTSWRDGGIRLGFNISRAFTL